MQSEHLTWWLPPTQSAAEVEKPTGLNNNKIEALLCVEQKNLAKIDKQRDQQIRKIQETKLFWNKDIKKVRGMLKGAVKTGIGFDTE